MADLWFQVYVWRDRGLTLEMLARAAAAGYETIVITVDTAVLGRRERDVRRGFTLPPKIGLDTHRVRRDAIRRGHGPSSRSEPIRFANMSTGPADDGSGTAVNLAQYINSQFDPSLSWTDIDWFRRNWDGTIVIKGIQSVADAKIAVDHGVDGIALSNHGGRQLDGSPAPIDLVAPVADAVGGRLGHPLRRRGSAGQRHREGRGPGSRCLHDRPGLPLRPRCGRRSGCRSCARLPGRGGVPDHGAHRGGGGEGARSGPHRRSLSVARSVAAMDPLTTFGHSDPRVAHCP